MSTTTSAVTIVPTVTLVIILPNIRITPTVVMISRINRDNYSINSNCFIKEKRSSK
jgi:hypothetical protein